MNPKIVLTAWLFCIQAVSAQLVITPGAQLSLAANTQMVLENMDIINNGSFLTGNSNIYFTGNTNAAISGTQPVQFYAMEINKGLFTSVLLQKGISVQQTIVFSAGFINLNGFDIDLGATGSLSGEKESSRVTGDNGGKLVFTAALNAPNAINPGNLGAVITSTQNLGNTIIRRGHASQTNAYNTGSSIKRYYEILPQNNSALNATLRLNYLIQELNGFDENNLYVWKANGNAWQNIGFTNRNTTLHYVEKAGLADFSRLTLSSASNALPVKFVLFNVNCNNGSALITWTTAQEQNTRQFQVEKSNDGQHFIAIGSVPAAGNSSTERTYLYTDNSNSSATAFYRIAETDLDGKKNYTAVNRLQCGNPGNDARVWPNPVNQMLFVNVNSSQPSSATIRIVNNQGAVVYTGQHALLKGSNQLQISMDKFAAGAYNMNIVWNDGSSRQVLQLVKQ